MNKIYSSVLIIIILQLPLLINCKANRQIKTDANYYKTEENDESLLASLKENHSMNVNFNTNNQILNTEKKAETIFNNKISGWNKDDIVTKGDVSIYKNKLKLVLPSMFGTKQGMVSKIEVPNKNAYQLEFDVSYEKGFHFSKGGKVGFGFAIGEGVTGGKTEAIKALKGGSFRVIWLKRNEKHYLAPYVYYQDMKGKYGKDFEENKYLIQSGKEYSIRLTIKTNSHHKKKDGYAKMEIKESKERNYKVLWENANIRWSANQDDEMRKITYIYFNLFRGGGDDSYSGKGISQGVYFDNLGWKVIQ